MATGITISGEGVLHQKSSDLVQRPRARRQIMALKRIKVTDNKGPVDPGPEV
jgi:hypothetical protein